MSDRGSVEYPNPDVIPNRVILVPNGTGLAYAGDIVKSGVFYGLLQNNILVTDTTAALRTRSLTVLQNVRVSKTSASIADGDPLIFVANPTGTANDYWVRTAVAGEAIHAYALETKTTEADILIHGPLRPPFDVVGGTGAGIADILTTLAGATDRMAVLADGAGGIKLTAYVMPTADGNAGQQLETDGSASVTWQAAT
jgi:hypothetical protein